MSFAARYGVCLVVALAVARVATAGQTNKGFNQALRVQAASSKAAESPTKVTKDATPTKTKDAEEPANKTDPISKGFEAYKSWTPPHKAKAFKMPKYHHADSLSAATDGFLDWFIIAYWGVVLLIVVGVEVLHRQLPEVFLHNSPRCKEELSAIKEEPVKEAEEDPSAPSAPARPQLNRTVSILAGHDISSADLLGETIKEKSLAPNVFSLMLVAARGEAKDRKQNILSPKLVFVAGLAMGLIQFLTLFLVVYDIDPSASPYTTKPGSPWKTSPLTVNTMKVVMTFFLGMYVVSEAADAYDNFVLGVALKGKDLLIHWSCVLFTPIFHYLITLSVILAGVSVVLSCQDVPNILYNSMAILFITRVDELFWGFFERTFDIEAKWDVTINQSDVAEVQLIKKCIIMFPMLWGFCLLGRAWYRDQMPALVVRVMTGHF